MLAPVEMPGQEPMYNKKQIFSFLILFKKT